MSRPRLALVYPRFRYPSGDPPVGIATLAAWVRHALPVQVAIHDGTFQPGLDPVRRFLDRYQPDYVGIGASTMMLPDALAVAELASARGAKVFLGGPHPTIDPLGLLADHPDLDAVVVGEGEESLTDLLRAWLEGEGDAPVAGVASRDADGEPLLGPARAPMVDLDRLPMPAWDLLDMRRYLRAWGKLDFLQPGIPGSNVSAGRGCPHRCSFCQPTLTKIFGRRLRLRSPRQLVDELEALHRRHGARGFWFTDDTFTARPDWVRAFCERYRASGLGLPWGCTSRADSLDARLLTTMSEAGLVRLGVGLESAVARIREGVYQKGTSLEQVRTALSLAQERDIHTFIFLMLGAPGETLAEMLETVHAAARLPADDASFALCVPLPGTTLHANIAAEGTPLSHNPRDYDYYGRQPFPSELPLWALRALQRYGWARFYAPPTRWPQLAHLVSHPAGWRALALLLQRLHPHAS